MTLVWGSTTPMDHHLSSDSLAAVSVSARGVSASQSLASNWGFAAGLCLCHLTSQTSSAFAVVASSKSCVQLMTLGRVLAARMQLDLTSHFRTTSGISASAELGLEVSASRHRLTIAGAIHGCSCSVSTG